MLPGSSQLWYESYSSFLRRKPHTRASRDRVSISLLTIYRNERVADHPDRKLFVWGNNDKCQLGMDNGIASPEDAGSQSVSPGSEEGLREINIPH
jgi:hypothetical protein